MGSSTRRFLSSPCAKAWPKYWKAGAGARLSSTLDWMAARQESVGAFWPNWAWTLCPQSRTGCRTCANSGHVSLRDPASQSTVFSRLSSQKGNMGYVQRGPRPLSVWGPRLLPPEFAMVPCCPPNVLGPLPPLPHRRTPGHMVRPCPPRCRCRLRGGTCRERGHSPGIATTSPARTRPRHRGPRCQRTRRRPARSRTPDEEVVEREDKPSGSATRCEPAARLSSRRSHVPPRFRVFAQNLVFFALLFALEMRALLPGECAESGCSFDAQNTVFVGKKCVRDYCVRAGSVKGEVWRVCLSVFRTKTGCFCTFVRCGERGAFDGWLLGEWMHRKCKNQRFSEEKRVPGSCAVRVKNGESHEKW